LTDSLQLSVVAMGIVFVALFALSLLMSALPKLVGSEKQAAAKSQAAVKPETPVVAEAKVEPAEEIKNTGLSAHTLAAIASAIAADEAERAGLSAQKVAVIAGAIAAYLGQAPEGLNIIAIRRTGSKLGPWSMTARRESVQNY
jgi:Na+-transporting methylmalonyl-CoA/oxaloacetate decarboxylase gamma subunit